MNVTIRPATLADNAKIRPLQEEIAALHHEGRPDIFKTEARFYTDEDFAAKLENPNHYVYVAETDAGEIVGYSFSWIIEFRDHSTFNDCDTFYIDDICVAEKYRRQGIGKKLYDKCLDTAKERKCHNIDLGVYTFNKNAIAFYKSCGFKDRVIRMDVIL